ncbi:uncharacterized protein LOC122504567 [Leptopilina heterotoma]|uniref:uncharacterized protein LOC122504567 n=1 Tax=Leptopilina heterotoma TaxID=63436 RepID=UPI001CA99FE8|nr:uncharacterized protein LOC122504567 [Leptopilina heterotoma]
MVQRFKRKRRGESRSIVENSAITGSRNEISLVATFALQSRISISRCAILPSIDQCQEEEGNIGTRICGSSIYPKQKFLFPVAQLQARSTSQVSSDGLTGFRLLFNSNESPVTYNLEGIWKFSKVDGLG